MGKLTEGFSSHVWQTLLIVWTGVAILIMALAFMTLLNPAMAGQPGDDDSAAGIIVSADGDTSLVRTGQITSPAGRLQEVFSGDRLKTGPNGRINLRFTDGMRMSLGPATQLHIDDYQDQAGQERSFFDLVRGSLRTITGLIGKSSPSAFKLNTPTAVIGIRGTDFTVLQADCARTDCTQGDSAAMEVSVTSGAVDVGNQAGSLLVMAGQTARIGKRGSAPQLVQAASYSAPRRPVTRRPQPDVTTPPAAGNDAPATAAETGSSAPGHGQTGVNREYRAPGAGEFFAPRR